MSIAFADVLQALAGAGAAIAVLVTSVISSKTIAEALTKRLSSFLKGSEILLFEQLGEHDLIIKLKLLRNHSHYIKHLTVSENPLKVDLFTVYVKVLCDTLLAEVVKFTDKTVLEYNEQTFKDQIYQAFAKVEETFNSSFKNHLLTINDDPKAATIIINKLAHWRSDYLSIMVDNCISVVSSGGSNKATAYTVATVFSVIMTGVDYLKRNGAESFYRLNGELDNFLTTQNKKHE